MLCGYESKTLFPEGPGRLECEWCGAMNPVPFEKELITEVEAEEICVRQGITLEDLLT